jgi:hypothetical protein
MPIAISCPHCDWKGSVKDELAGKKGKCPTCGELIPIPDQSSPRPLASDDPDDRPRSKSKPYLGEGRTDRGRRDRYDEEDRPRRRRDPDDEYEGRPRRRPIDEEDEGRPSRSRRRAADHDDEPRPRRRRFDDEYDDDRPRRRGRGGRVERRDKSGGTSKVSAIVGGAVLLGLGIVLLGISLLVGRMNYWGIGLVVVGIISLGQGLMRKD